MRRRLLVSSVLEPMFFDGKLFGAVCFWRQTKRNVIFVNRNTFNVLNIEDNLIARSRKEFKICLFTKIGNSFAETSSS